MKKKKLQCSVPTLLLAGVLCLTLAACGAKQSSDMLASDTDSAASAALPVKAMNAKRVDENPYMAKSDANIHHDGYNTDSTDEVLPLGIYPEINVSYEKTNANASPAIYFDSYGHAVVPLLGGIAIRDLNAKETTTLGYFSPKQHDGGGYVIQSSYTFLDSENRIVCPTSNNHVLMLRATDEAGNVLPEFEKVLDIDIKAAAEEKLGKTLDPSEYEKKGENVWIAKSATVAPTASITGPAIIGREAEVRHCAFIRGKAIVGEGAVVGNSTELKNAVLFNKVQVPHYNYVGDAVLGYKSHMGAGSICSNVKSDKKLVVVKDGDEKIETGLKKFGAMLGDHVEVGCGSVLNPGTVIGRNSNIYPLSPVRGCVPADSIYKNAKEIVKKK
mgnify:CR=1 FL=1